MTTLGPPRHRPTLAKDAAPPRLHRVRLGALVAMLPLASCGPSAGPFVTLLLTNFPPETARVALQVTTDDDSKQQQFSGNDSLNVITVEFPVGTRGPVTFDAETSLDSGCVLGSGTATLPISDDKAYDLKLPIAVDPKRKCTAAPVKLTVRKMGSAQGVITSSPVTEPCDETCSQQTIDYRAGDLTAAIALVAPSGVDVHFESVGQEVLDAVLPTLNRHARIALCGLVSQYGREGGATLRNFDMLLTRAIRLEGFGVSDYDGQRSRIIAELESHALAGRILVRETVTRGLENAPKALAGLFSGRNIGKQIVTP